MKQSFETIAAYRFGYGFRPGEPEIGDVDGIMRQLRAPDAGLAQFSGPDLIARKRLFRAYIQTRRKFKRGDDFFKEKFHRLRDEMNLQLANDDRNVLLRAAYSGQGFRERLAVFWTDHFTVAPKGKEQDIIYGDYVEHAIRPNITGNFADLLQAAVTHPSMLVFLDQVKSIGPNSFFAKGRERKGLGLNENLAREILELHTLGAGGPYDQKDVRELAELLTGLVLTRDGSGFMSRRAEPGAERILDHSYGKGPPSFKHIKRFLRDVAVHPATAQHICWKLAVHFVSDEPDQQLLSHMTTAYRKSKGQLTKVYEAMLEHPAAWVDLGQKVKQPLGFMVSSLRALDIPKDDLLALDSKNMKRFLFLPLLSMGQPMRRAPGPNGWPEEADAWITPQGLAARLQWSLGVAQKMAKDQDPRQLVDTTLRELAGETLRFAVAGAEHRAEGVTLVLASPEFNRR